MAKLIINTANEDLILSLYDKDKVFYKVNSAKMHHNEVMLPLIDELLTENNYSIKDVKELGVVIGPGSFTGIRVGIATIKSFRDALKIIAKGINNLDFLFKLCNSQNKEIETVAILGSFNSYFVAKLINGVVYKYPHNLTLEDLKQIAENKQIGMFKEDENLDCFVPKFDAKVLLDCFEQSVDYNLTPVYYQLSQAENEKLKRASVQILEADNKDFEDIKRLENENILTNVMGDKDIKLALNDERYKTFKVLVDEKTVGFIILQITDEVCIMSIAVDKSYRNLGLATKLIESAENYAKSKNIETISLEVGYKNITAYLLYKKLGFEKRRLRKKYYADGTDCIEMSKKLI